LVFDEATRNQILLHPVEDLPIFIKSCRLSKFQFPNLFLAAQPVKYQLRLIIYADILWL
jgi:hypothetical protein